MSVLDVQQLTKWLAKAYDLNAVLRKFMIGSVQHDHWRKVDSTIENYFKIKQYIHSLTEDILTRENTTHEPYEIPSVIWKIIKLDDKEISELKKLLKMAIDIGDTGAAKKKLLH